MDLSLGIGHAEGMRWEVESGRDEGACEVDEIKIRIKISRLRLMK